MTALESRREDLLRQHKRWMVLRLNWILVILPTRRESDDLDGGRELCLCDQSMSREDIQAVVYRNWVVLLNSLRALYWASLSSIAEGLPNCLKQYYPIPLHYTLAQQITFLYCFCVFPKLGKAFSNPELVDVLHLRKGIMVIFAKIFKNRWLMLGFSVHI